MIKINLLTIDDIFLNPAERLFQLLFPCRVRYLVKCRLLLTHMHLKSRRPRAQEYGPALDQSGD